MFVSTILVTAAMVTSEHKFGSHIVTISVMCDTFLQNNRERLLCFVFRCSFVFTACLVALEVLYFFFYCFSAICSFGWTKYINNVNATSLRQKFQISVMNSTLYLILLQNRCFCLLQVNISLFSAERVIRECYHNVKPQRYCLVI